MRKSIAAFLRRLADYIYPPEAPLGDLTIRISADTCQAIAAFDELEARAARLAEAIPAAVLDVTCNSGASKPKVTRKPKRKPRVRKA